MAISMKAARVHAGLTQKQAAKELGMSKSTLASYESGKTVPKIDVAQQMASLYGFTVNEISFFAY